MFVNNIKPTNNYLIVAFSNDFQCKQYHAYSSVELNKKVTELVEDPTIHDFVIYSKVDFDLERI